MKQGGNYKAPRRITEKYEKLNESLFVHMRKMYFMKQNIPNKFKDKNEVYNSLYVPMLDFYLRGTDAKVLTT